MGSVTMNNSYGGLYSGLEPFGLSIYDSVLGNTQPNQQNNLLQQSQNQIQGMNFLSLNQPVVKQDVEEIRTIFITGFPSDVKERELNNLLRFFPGYEACQMNWNKGQVQCFALFSNGIYAMSSVDQLNNFRFDSENVLRCEMAHKNMYFKDEGLLLSRTQSYLSSQVPSEVKKSKNYGKVQRSPQSTLSGIVQLNVNNYNDNPPCNTLFIGNLGDSVSMDDLNTFFGQFTGFIQLKMVRNSKGVNCFVEFKDIVSAKKVHDNKQGILLKTSDRGPIRIQYSKNPFGFKKDKSQTSRD